MSNHPRLALGLTVAGLASLFLGVAGVPSDIENWGKAFAWLGSNGGRWVLAVLGFLAVVITAVAPRLPERSKRHKAPPRNASRTQNAQQQALKKRQFHQRREEKRLDQLKRDVQAELVAIIDQGNALIPDAFSSVEPAPLKFWRDGAVVFVENVFGSLERQRFLENYDPSPDDQAGWIEHRLKRLSHLRDSPNSWDLKVDRPGFRVTVELRRHASEADRIALAASASGRAQLPSRESRDELAADIRTLADTIDRILKEGESREKWEIDDMERRGSKLTAGQSPDAIRAVAVGQAQRRTKTIWLSDQWRAANELFDQAQEFGVVMASERDRYVDPEPSEVAGVPEAFRKVAERLEQFEIDL